MRFIGFSNASFSDKKYFTSHLGYPIFIGERIDLEIRVFFKSHKARRVTRSFMGAELISFIDMFDADLTSAEELRHLLPNVHVSFQLFMYRKTLFDVIYKGTITSEKRLMIDVSCAREGFKNHEISDIGLVKSSVNTADVLTKSMCQAGISSLISSVSLNLQVEQ